MTTTELVTKETCPEMQDWMLLTDAARELGYTRQNAHRLADRGKFQSLQSLGHGTVYVVSRAEVMAMKQSRAHLDEEVEPA
jgi:hypothetical protein